MSPQRILGIVLLVVGVAVLIYGVNASHSMADRLSDTFTGRRRRLGAPGVAPGGRRRRANNIDVSVAGSRRVR